MAHASPRFESTLWSAVLLAGREPDSEAGRRALARLCEAYWYPVYAYIRRRGAGVEDAQDLAQGFFAHILSSEFFSRARPEAGRFRNFLLGALGHFLAHAAEKQRSQRSGGRHERVPIDATLAEYWLGAEPTADNDAARAFDRSWANALVAEAVARLEREQAGAGRTAVFEALKEFLLRKAAPGEYDDIGRSLGMTKGAVAAAAHRLNRRFGELVRQNVRETVASADMAEDELAHLFAHLAG